MSDFSRNLDEMLILAMDNLVAYLEQEMSPPIKRLLSPADVAQETYIRAARNLSEHEYRGEKTFFRWLVAIATNYILAQIRLKEKELVVRHETLEFAQSLFNSNILTPSQILSVKENETLLAIALAQLSNRHQEILKFRYYEGLSFVEIAEITKMSSSQVRGLHRNALLALKKTFGRLALFRSSIVG